MTVENVLFSIIGVSLLMTTRGVFLLTYVYQDMRRLSESTEADKGKFLVLKRQAGEGLILLIVISGLALALFLFAHEGIR